MESCLVGGGRRFPGRTVDRDDDFARSGSIPVLTQPDSLPLAQAEAAVRDRDRQGGAHETGFDMSRHVIGSLARVSERNTLHVSACGLPTTVIHVVSVKQVQSHGSRPKDRGRVERKAKVN